MTQNSPLETDALIVGAGPAGLFQVFQLGLLEIRTHVVDALPYAGGQCVELYADKPIYDIPSVPVCTGRELTDNLLKQIKPMQAQFHFSQTVTAIARQTDGRFLVQTSKSTAFLTKAIFIAGGVGSFQPKTLKVEGLDAFHGTQLAYQVTDASLYVDQRVVIVGENDTALDWALRLCAANDDGYPHKAASVTVVHRRDAFSAAPDTVARFRAKVAAGAIAFVAGQVAGIQSSAQRLVGVQIAQPDTSLHPLATDQLLVLQGLSPKLGPIADWGLAMERRQLVVDTETFATSEPGIFAVGDINTYPGKKKLILCAFHECVLAAFGAAAYLYPDRKALLEYTTSSSRLHKVLGLG